MGDLLKDLSDIDVMEYVSDDRLLTIPLSSGDKEKRPLPAIEVEVVDEELSVSLVYREAEGYRHLRNILHPSQVEEQSNFSATMKLLPISFETRLSKRGFKENSFSLQKKYVASRVDAAMLSRLLDEAEVIRSGGRKTSSGRSVYETPATPVLQVVYVRIKADEEELKRVLLEMKPMIILLSAVKTQSEIIHSSLSKPVDEAAKYRVFIDILNKARYLGMLSAEERRGLDKKWRETTDERGPIEEDLKRRLGEST